MSKKFVAVCCFCGCDVPRKGLEPLSLSVFAAKGGRAGDTEQTFWCHKKCLVGAMVDPSILREELGGPRLKGAIDWSVAARVEGGRGMTGLRKAIKILRQRKGKEGGHVREDRAAEI